MAAMEMARLRALIGFVLAATVGSIAAKEAGAPWGWAVVTAGLSGALGAFLPGWVDRASERDSKRRAFRELAGPELGESPAWLLRAERKVVPFVGRSREVAGLLAWCEDGDSVPVRMLTGPGGIGKSRLAERVMEELRTKGWECSAVDDGLEATAWVTAREASRRRVLLVVDYAETRTGLVDLLRDVARESTKSRIRVLLIARGVGDWWDVLAAQSAPIRALVEGVSVDELEADLGAGLTDRELVDSAVPHFARALGIDTLGPIDASIPQSEDGRVPVLVLHAAALVAVLDAQSPVAQSGEKSLVVTASDIFRVLLGHEGRLWMGTRPKTMERFGVGICRAVVALGCLVVPKDSVEASDCVGRVEEVADLGSGGRLEVAWWLRRLYPPGESGWWGSLAPDLVAEHLVCEVLADSPERMRRFLGGLSPAAAASALTVLARATVHHSMASELLEAGLRADFPSLSVPAVQVAVHSGAAVGEVVARVVPDVPAAWDELVRMKEAIPYPTTALASADLALVQRILRQMPKSIADREHAKWLTQLGVALSEVGRSADALAPAEQAVQIRRRLADDDPDHLLGELAISLRELGSRYWGLGQADAALAATRESIEILRSLATVDHGSYLGELARSLVNLGVCLFHFVGPAEALEPTREALEIRRRLAEADPAQHLGNLAISLNNMGVALSTLGRHADALQPALESIELYRRLAETEPDRYLGLLAGALSNLSNPYGKLGRPAHALAPVQESIQIYRRLVRTNPDRYIDELGETLVNFSDTLAALNRPAEALAPAEEAVKIRRRLVQANADRYQGDLAISLTSLASRLAALGRLNEALAPRHEAVEIYRHLLDAGRENHRDHLAEALRSLADVLTNLGQSDAAAKAYADAQELERD